MNKEERIETNRKKTLAVLLALTKEHPNQEEYITKAYIEGRFYRVYEDRQRPSEVGIWTHLESYLSKGLVKRVILRSTTNPERSSRGYRANLDKEKEILEEIGKEFINPQGTK